MPFTFLRALHRVTLRVSRAHTSAPSSPAENSPRGLPLWQVGDDERKPGSATTEPISVPVVRRSRSLKEPIEVTELPPLWRMARLTEERSCVTHPALPGRNG